jgi:hypothetical protein
MDRTTRGYPRGDCSTGLASIAFVCAIVIVPRSTLLQLCGRAFAKYWLAVGLSVCATMIMVVRRDPIPVPKVSKRTRLLVSSPGRCRCPL